MRRILFLTVFLLAGCGGDDDTGGDEGAGGRSVELVATEFAFEPADVTVDEAGEITFTVSNEGQATHALEVEGNGIEEETDTFGPGESGSLTADLEPGEYVLYCPVGNHREQGMEGTLVVGGAGTGTSDESGSERDDPYG